jgi:K+-sensing histidine kinase KdpD
MGALSRIRPKTNNVLRRYGLAIAVNLTALLFTWLLEPLTQQTRFIFFFAAVAINAYYCGFGPAMVTAGFAVLSIGYLFFPALFSLALLPLELLTILVFILIAGLMSALTQALRQAEHQAQQAIERTEHLQHITAAFSTAQTSADVAQVVVEQSVAAIGAALGSLRILTPDGTALRELYNTDNAILAPWSVIQMSNAFPLTDAARSGQPVWLESLAAVQARYPELVPVMQQYGYRASASLPVIVENRILGAIALSFAQPHTFTREDQTFLMVMAQLCGQALERARLYDAERAARSEAEAAVRHRDQFLSVAAHELRTPLTAMLGNAQLLQRRMLRADNREERDERTIRVLVEQAQRLNNLIQTLLDVSRLELGQLTIKRMPFDLCALVRRIVDEAQIGLTRQTVQLTGCADPILINGDELRLEQVYLNLIQNAFKYSPPEAPVHVAAFRHNQEAVVTVTDHGVGIPESEQAHLFEAYYRGGNVHTQQASGLGIGLYVVNEIVSLYGGTVSVESTEGSGSTFTVSLPVGM